MGRSDTALLVAGALCGGLGVALAAIAAHAGGGNLDTASRFLLLHAPALLAIGGLAGARLVHPRAGRITGFTMLLGLVLFCGDLAIRALWGIAPLRLAAPTGGFLLIAAWLGLAIAAVIRPES